MLGKRSRSVIVRLSELLSHLDFFIGDPLGNDHPVACADDHGRKPNHCRRIVERDRGVGLAIVVALEKTSSSSDSRRGGGGTGSCSRYFVCDPSGHGRSDGHQGAEEEEEEEEEDYTYVTFHGPRESYTMVYHDRCESEVSEGGDGDSGRGYSPVLGFLSSCQLCGKMLHGQDVFMYKGEKGFCSAECRSAQVVIDERSELWQSEAPRSANAWSYPAGAYSEGQVFPTSILAV